MSHRERGTAVFPNFLYRIGINLAVCLIFPVYFGCETEEESLFSRVAPYKEQETVWEAEFKLRGWACIGEPGRGAGTPNRTV